MPFIVIALAVAAALGGGTSIAAQHALPGDVLWGFKVNVNERVEETLAQGDQNKANLDIQFAQERLDEAQKLAAQGNLDAAAQADVEANFDAHAQAVADRITALQTQGDYSAAADIAAKFQAAVAAHASTLADARAHADENAQAALTTVLDRVQLDLTSANKLSADASAQAASHPDTSVKAQDEGGEQASSSDDMGAQVEVHTGTSVKGGDGGIKANADGSGSIGI